MSALTALGGALRGADAWRADYTQEYIAAGMGAGEVVAGVVTVALARPGVVCDRRPGRFR